MYARRRLTWRPTIAAVAVGALLLLAGCGGKGARAHWPRSAGAMTVDDPDEDGGESLDPHQVSEEAAAVEHGGEDITDILDQPAVMSSPAPAKAPTSAAADPKPTAPDISPEGVPVFEEIIIVN